MKIHHRDICRCCLDSTT